MLNQYGLKRTIPSKVEREVRKRCGFGCVVCGSAIYQYEHFDPEYADATEHKANGITLLCGSCHDKKTRGLLSVETIKRFNDYPTTKTRGFANGALDFGVDFPEVIFGNFQIVDTPIILQIDNEVVIKIERPQEEGQPFLLSATLRNEAGEIILKIERNEWKTYAANWDAVVTGRRIKINSHKGNISLILRSEPPKTLVFERLGMVYRRYGIFLKENEGIKIITEKGILKGSSLYMAKFDVAITLLNSDWGFGTGSRVGSIIKARYNSDVPSNYFNWIESSGSFPNTFKF